MASLSPEEKKARNLISVNKYREKNKEKVAAAKALRKGDQAGYSLKHYLKNKEKIAARCDEWYKVNSDRIKNKNAERYKQKRHEILVKNKEWRDANPERMAALNKAWGKKHPERMKSQRQSRGQTRRARKLGVGGKLSSGLGLRLYKLQKGKCPCCKQPLGDDYHLDHKMPLALGGSNTDDNIQLLRKVCNLQKNARHPVDFMQSRGFLL